MKNSARELFWLVHVPMTLAERGRLRAWHAWIAENTEYSFERLAPYLASPGYVAMPDYEPRKEPWMEARYRFFFDTVMKTRGKCFDP